MLFMAAFAGLVVPFLASMAGLFVGWLGLLIFFKVLKSLDRDKKVEMVQNGYNFFARKIKQTVVTLLPDLQDAEKQVINRIAAPGDTLEAINNRYAYLIRLSPENQAVPPYLQHLITKRILFAYKEKFGDTDMRFFARHRFNVDDLLKPLQSEEEKARLIQFCLDPG
jgi:hypothetical protein